MEQTELTPSDIYLRKEVLFAPAKRYLVRAQSGRGKTSLLSFLYGERVVLMREPLPMME
jgi:ABC transporter, ATP-binding protein